MTIAILEEFLFSDIKTLISISENSSKALKRLGLINLRDLLFYSPISYQNKIIYPDLTTVKEGEIIQTKITIDEIVLPIKKHQPLKIIASNDTGSLILVFFHKLPSFIFNKLKINSSHIISGKIQFFNYHLQISHPEFIVNSKSNNKKEPIYSLTYSLNNKQLYSYIIKAIEIFEHKYKMLQLSPDITAYTEELLDNLKILHYTCQNSPNSGGKVLKSLAAKELMANQLSLYKMRQQIRLRQGNKFCKADDIQQSILNELGFKLTDHQQEVIKEIELDQNSEIEMMRLLQGDVGAGKTLVALLTMINTVANKFQTTLMAPTDLLANQHYEFFMKALKNTNIKVALLTGKVQSTARKNIMIDLQSGKIDILIGTHALFQEKVIFYKLGFIVIDEQHKFGVQQRLNLISKGSNPDVLIMTATPIPRSLALTVFGDMTISKLTGKPKNRLPIMTSIISINKITHLIEGIHKKLLLDEKIYWICLLIDQKDTKELEKNGQALIDVTSRFESIEEAYPGMVGIIHGKMKNEQKDAIMKQFKEGTIKILVATTVIEVGIDIPEASLIVIENAEQFGLAQLHQLRGRVGRSNVSSHCILLYNPKRLSKIARTRFEIMKQTNDGFFIAEQDLKLRGGGEILGTKQSGDIEFFFADLARDYDLIVNANKFARTYLKNQKREHLDFIAFQIKLFTKTELSDLN